MSKQSFITKDGHLENRFNGTFAKFAFGTHDQDRSMFIDLFNAVLGDGREDDLHDDLVRGRLVKIIANPYLTEVLYRKEHSWIVVGDGITDKDERFSVVLQLFTYPVFDFQIFGSDFNEMLSLRESMPPVPEAAALNLDPKRPTIVLSLLRDALGTQIETSYFHAQMRMHCKGARLGNIHQINCSHVDKLKRKHGTTRLALWTDFLCGRNQKEFASHAKDDPILGRLLGIERKFMDDPELMAEYADIEGQMSGMMKKAQAVMKKYRKSQSHVTESAVLKDGVFNVPKAE